jgi:hypothetical protein
MSLAIHKYPITLQAGVSDVTLPKGAKILHASDQREEFKIWAIVDLEEKSFETRRFLVLGTGQKLDRADFARLEHISTVLSGSYVWHIFEWL